MSEIGRELFPSLVVEVIVLVIAIIFRDDKKKSLVFLGFGTIIAFVIGYYTTSPQLDSDSPQNLTPLVTDTSPPIQVTTNQTSTHIAINGRWTGPIEQPGSLNYSVELVLVNCTEGSVCGSIKYPELECGGTVAYLGKDGEVFRLQETITYGKERCIELVTIELAHVEGQTRKAYYSRSGPSGGVSAEATLQKID